MLKARQKVHNSCFPSCPVIPSNLGTVHLQLSGFETVHLLVFQVYKGKLQYSFLTIQMFSWALCFQAPVIYVKGKKQVFMPAQKNRKVH